MVSLRGGGTRPVRGVYVNEFWNKEDTSSGTLHYSETLLLQTIRTVQIYLLQCKESFFM